MWTEANEVATIVLRNARQVTFTAAVETDPSWAPDGGRIAFVSDQSGNDDIWISPAAGGAAVNLTADHTGGDHDPAWSPDGNQIAFISQRDGGGVFVMPAIGGRPVRLSPQGVAEGVTSPVWSADGTELAHMRREPEANFIEILNLDTRESRRLRVPGEQGGRFQLSWSRDGLFFAYVRAPNRDQEVNRLWMLRVADGEALAVTDGPTGSWNPIWSHDGRTLFFISNRGGSRDLWQQRLTRERAPSGEPSPITLGVGMQQATLSADGTRLAYSRGRPVANIWRVKILDDREAGWEDAEPLTFDEALVQTLDLLPDREELVISSDRGGSLDLWLAPIDGTEMRRLTTDRGPEDAPRVSPDGKQIAFYSNRQGNLDIWVMPVDGGPAVQLSRSRHPDMFPAWSPDGKSIAFYGGRDDGVNVFTVPSSGGAEHQITTGPVSKYFPQWSPDRRWIYFASEEGRSRSYRVFRMPATGGNAEQVTSEPAYYYRWSHDGTRMYFPGRENNDLWELPLTEGRERRLTRFTQRRGTLGRLALAAGKAHLYFTWGSNIGDIWVMDVVADDEP
jgi:Tol biopolymer transport system component